RLALTFRSNELALEVTGRDFVQCVLHIAPTVEIARTGIINPRSAIAVANRVSSDNKIRGLLTTRGKESRGEQEGSQEEGSFQVESGIHVFLSNAMGPDYLVY